MADPLQPELPTRSPQISEGVANRQGLVTPPDNVDTADNAMDDLFKKHMGRDPSALDDTPDRDRNKDTDPAIETASEVPELADPTAEELVEKPIEDKAEEKAPVPEKPEKKSFLEDLLPDEEIAPLSKESKKASTEETPEKKEDEADPYEAQKLRSDTSERTKETFEKLKQTARERESAARQEAEKFKKSFDEAQKELTSLKEQTKPVPDDIKSELEELRAFRLAHDTENDPAFKQKFDGRREENEKTVYDILRRGGLKDAVLEQLKGLSYEERVEHITRWSEKLSPREKLLITSRLSDNETIELERARALTETKANATKTLAERKAPSSEEYQQNFLKDVVSTLKPVLPNVPILHPKEIPTTATVKEKEELEAHNAKAAEYQGKLLTFLQDQTPATKGVLALAGVLAPYYRSQLQAAQSQLKAAQTELSKIKQAGKLSRLSTSSAPSKGSGVGPLMDLPADEALDEMWKAMNPTDR
jgi:hypothetical protein